MGEKKEEIITTATRLFAARGFGNVSVRDICAAAHVSVAMVNYHFKNKEGLYRECLERLFAETNGEAMMSLAKDVHDAASWRAAMRCWITGFSAAMHAKSSIDGGSGGIFRQEVVNPSSLQPFLEEHYGKPILNSLKELLSMAVDTPRQVDLWATAIWSQLSAYALVAPVWQRHFRPKNLAPEQWGKAFADFVCERILKELKFRSRTHKS